MNAEHKNTNNHRAHNIVFIAIKGFSENNELTVNIRGTGFILKHKGKQYIVTCAHVYQQLSVLEKRAMSCGVVSVDTKDKQIKKYNFYDVNFLAEHPEQRRDICLLEFKGNHDEIVDYGYDSGDLFNEIDIEKLKTTEAIFFMGYPLANEFLQMGMGVTLAASQTTISSIKYSNDDKRVDFIIIDKLVNPGSSGSPVFLKDKIIGVASGTLNKSHRIGETLINVPVNIGIIRTSNYILELLEK